MKKVLIGVLIAVVALGIIAPFTFAGPGQRGKYEGTVKNIDYSAKKFDLVGDNNYSVIYTDDTVFVHDGNKVEPTELKDGEKVLLSGPLSDDGKTINAHTIAWGTLPGKGDKRQPLIKGTVDKLNLESKKFELKTKDSTGNEIIFTVTYTDSTKFIRDLKPSKPEEFKNGEEVTVTGKIDLNGKKIEAMAVIYGNLPQQPPGDRGPRGFLKNAIRGEVSVINYNAKEFTLIQTEKESIKVKYEDWTDFIKDGTFVFPEELKNGDKVNVFGPLNKETNTVQAHKIIWGQIRKGPGGK
jgi:cytochrome c-type biogenesis protein CcmE